MDLQSNGEGTHCGRQRAVLGPSLQHYLGAKELDYISITWLENLLVRNTLPKRRPGDRVIMQTCLRALVVGENSLLQGAADRPVIPGNTLWNACTATFSWQAASSALQSYLIRSSKPSSQCFSSLLLPWHSSQAILSGRELSIHLGLSPRSASTNRLLERSLASLIRVISSPW